MATNGVGSGLNFDYINATVATAVRAKEVSLHDKISEIGNDPSTSDLLMMQQQVQQWTMMTQIQSTLVKEIADAMKGVIQKSG